MRTCRLRFPPPRPTSTVIEFIFYGNNSIYTILNYIYDIIETKAKQKLKEKEKNYKLENYYDDIYIF